MIFVFVKTYGKQSIWMIIALILCVTVADKIASGVLKETVCRLRPSQNPDLDGLIHLVNGYRSGLYGFASSHAANSFALAALSALFLRNKFFVCLVTIWAVINCYSRMYLGVHYPLDILAGAFIGTIISFLIYFIYKKIFKNFEPKEISNCIVLIPFGVWVLSVLMMMIM
jgi:undecaprenyl-diphosphatase